MKNQEKILQNLAIDSLNPMQIKMGLAMSEKKDLVLLSPTGSGKTLAFLLPLLELFDTQETAIQALILVPSRELGLQIERVFKSMKTDFKVNCFYGGHPFKLERNSLSTPPAVLVGTPGRIADHLDKQTFATDKISTVIFDEFDKSLEFGFEGEMKQILERLPSIKKKVLTSATQAIAVPDFVQLHQSETLDFISDSDEAEGLDVKLVLSEDIDKLNTLQKLIGSFPAHESAIVFCNHRESVDRICGHLAYEGIVCDSFHGGLDQELREQALSKFRNGSVSVLVTTDLASRGIDIAHIKHIIHYQQPQSEEIFTHRNGRTARMGAKGTAYVIITPKDEKLDYITEEIIYPLHKKNEIYQPPLWTTLKLVRGKKDNVNKMDVVGFLSKIGALKREELGIVEIKDFVSYAAVATDKVDTVIHKVANQKIKGKTVKVEVV